jgi:hypothetical protein
MRRFYIQSSSQNRLGVASAHNKDTYTMGFPWSYIHCGPLDGRRHILQSSISLLQMKWYAIWSKGQDWMWIRSKYEPPTIEPHALKVWSLIVFARLHLEFLTHLGKWGFKSMLMRSALGQLSPECWIRLDLYQAPSPRPWGFKTPQWGPRFVLKIGPKLEDRFLKLHYKPKSPR